MSKRKIAEIDALLDREPKAVARSGNVVLEMGSVGIQSQIAKV